MSCHSYGARVAARLAIGQLQFVEDDVTTCPEVAGLRRVRLHAHTLCKYDVTQATLFQNL